MALIHLVLGFLLTLYCKVGKVEAVNLYVASYSGGSFNGNITTLSLLQTPDSSYSLKQTSTLNTSTNSPSWLTLNRHNNVLYLIDEAVNSTTNGTVVAYRTSPTGKLAEISRTKAQVGGVDAVFYASGAALAVPHYTGSLLQTYDISDSGLTLHESFAFKSPIGPVADRQEAPHPHQAILDPTESFILVPDLGADVVRVFSIGGDRRLTAKEPLHTSPGYGPRHGTFSRDPIAGNYIFYLVGELAGKITAYRVNHNSSGLSFSEIASYDTLSVGKPFPPNPDGSSKVAPAEITVTVSS
jgi:6-phosphogluconolactonase (cycloisomerase 2 family)